jgi:hypothetical protein
MPKRKAPSNGRKNGSPAKPAGKPPESLLDFQQVVGANVEMKLLAKELEYLVGSGNAVTTEQEVREFISLGRQVLDDLEKLVQ